MLRLTLASLAAILCALAGAAPAGADEPRYPVPVLDRLGRLPYELAKTKRTDAEVADAMFLAALLRLPKDDERERTVKHIASKTNRMEALQNVAWSLVNTKEFMKLHGIDGDLKKTLEFYNKDVNELWGKIAGEMKKAEK